MAITKARALIGGVLGMHPDTMAHLIYVKDLLNTMCADMLISWLNGLLS